VTVALLVAIPVLANLPNSTFEGNDGNLVVNTAGNTDWSNAPDRVRGDDLASGGSDNSFGQGTKEDDPNVSVVTGSIPPQKSDLTRFYVASEFASNSNFLYLAWERSNVLGSANMDFEINQKTQPNLTTTGPKTLSRTAGDLLITFDFTNGGGNPVLGLLKWVTTGAASQCFSANKVPCWGNRVDLSAAGFAEGAVNTTTVTDPIANVSLPALTFGEAAVNLTAAGVFPAGTCEAFGSAFLKSRSSASFPAEVKDFVAPQPVNISNCGNVIIHKVTVPSPDPTDTTFHYTTTGGLNPATFTLKDGGTRDYQSQVTAGSYSVTESDPSPDFALTNLDCSASEIGDGSTVTPNTSTRTASFDLKPSDTIECTYTNTLQRGAIKIHKTTIKDGTGLAGAEFDVRKKSDNSLVEHVTTDSSGNACVAGLPLDVYTVNETAAPTGYKIDDTTTHDVTVDSVATCSSGDPEGPINFSDTPLSRITVSFDSLAAGNPTSATVQCTGEGSPSPLPESTPKVLDNLVPGTYTCTVVVDP
jgi:Prealbumin-like fold domain